jgi:hypothetical protein
MKRSSRPPPPKVTPAEPAVHNLSVPHFYSNEAEIIERQTRQQTQHMRRVKDARHADTKQRRDQIIRDKVREFGKVPAALSEINKSLKAEGLEPVSRSLVYGVIGQYNR